ncbi:hypothetical protein [Paraburkholderia humisilvae]|uniref:DUF4148 domain-containing protein n=1 Tax=Paraburkholderia humisilvae TaxID=627669 RepID=A0A6J5E2K5_9BURK|nr:hypothetical protein [Paraburkholderia humisilvae]CAB3759914.1 hypothetical protein LMG29542_03704 [Paraburkholderia humisilvae]
MKLSLIKRFTLLTAALALSHVAREAAAKSMNPPAASESNGVPMGSIKQDARKMLEMISDVRYTGEVNADFIAQIVLHRQDAIDPADGNAPTASPTNRVSRLRQIAEQLASGQAKEIEATKPATGTTLRASTKVRDRAQ